MLAKPTEIDLTTVIAKLDWAEKHVDAFRLAGEAFAQRDPTPFGMRHESSRNPDGSEDYRLYAVVRERPPLDFALIIGDVAHNVRSALDHLVYALSSRQAQRSGKTQFPIFTDECRFKVLGIPMIASLKRPERTLIERVQPFAAVVPDDDPLAILNRLSNLDKHRLPVTVGAATGDTSTWIGTDNANCQYKHIAHGAVAHDELVVAFTASPVDPSRPMAVDAHSVLQVQIKDKNDDGRINGMAALDVLRMIHGHARHTVIEHWFTYGNMPVTLAQRNGLEVCLTSARRSCGCSKRSDQSDTRVTSESCSRPRPNRVTPPGVRPVHLTVFHRCAGRAA
jgi:hypothetical protein